MIDFHSHIIYGIDDGAKDIETSIKMLQIAKNEGTTNICGTSHFIPKVQELNKEDYKERLKNIKELATKEKIDINIISGLEIYMTPELPNLYKQNRIWGINDNKYMLIELPMEQFPIYVEDIFYELQVLGVKPILAHPERNLEIIHDKGKLRKIISTGVLAQINSGSLTGMYGKDVKKCAEYFVMHNMAHLMGSDAHSANRRGRSPKIKDAENILKKMNEELYNWISKNSDKILQGEEVEILPVKKEKKFRLFSFLKN